MKNKSWKQKAVAIFTGIFIVLLAMTMLTGCGKTGSNGSTSKKSSYQSVAIQDIQNDLANNPVSAKNKYLNKKIKVTGIINKIDVYDGEHQYFIQAKNSNDLTFEDLNDPTITTCVVGAVRTGSDMDKKLSKYQIGQYVTFQGKVIKIGDKYLAMEVDWAV